MNLFFIAAQRGRMYMRQPQPQHIEVGGKDSNTLTRSTKDNYVVCFYRL